MMMLKIHRLTKAELDKYREKCNFTDRERKCFDLKAKNRSAVNNAKSDVTAQLYNNEIASLNRSFAEQTANAQGFNGVQAGLCDAKYAGAQNTRDIITAITAGVQSIKDDLCADRLANAQREVDAERRENANLRSQIQKIYKKFMCIFLR